MKKYAFIFLVFMFLIEPTLGESLLSAQSFPKTFNDLGFTERIDILAEGYEPYETEYETGPNGNLICVSGCAYRGMSIEENERQIQQDTVQSLQDAIQYQQNRQNPENQTGINSSGQNQHTNLVTQIDNFLGQNNNDYANCIARNPAIPQNQEIPWGEPLIGQPRISSPFGRRIHPVTHKTHNHTGIDYAVPNGTYVYTTANGVVTRKWTDKKCGNGLKIKYATGLSAIYCHLDHTLVKENENVYAGCAVAVSDNSGTSTGPHLHYGMKDSKGNFINPTAYTKRAK